MTLTGKNIITLAAMILGLGTVATQGISAGEEDFPFKPHGLYCSTLNEDMESFSIEKNSLSHTGYSVFYARGFELSAMIPVQIKASSDGRHFRVHGADRSDSLLGKYFTAIVPRNLADETRFEFRMVLGRRAPAPAEPLGTGRCAVFD